MLQNRYINIARSESSPTEPCTLTEAKAQAIITYPDDDTLITAYITKARKMIENYCNISIVAQNITLIAELYKEWELPYGPVTGILSVQTRTGTEGSGPASYATASTGWNTDGVDFLTFNPAGATDEWNMTSFPFDSPGAPRYKIDYTAGYITVPADLKQAVLMQVVWLYDHRGEEDQKTVCESARIFADPYKRLAWL